MSPGSRKQPKFEMMAPGESLVASRPRCRTRLFAGRSQRQASSSEAAARGIHHLASVVTTSPALFPIPTEG